MASRRHPLTIVLFSAFVVCIASVSTRAQEPQRGESSAGAGWLAPGVFITWEAHRELIADGQAVDGAAAPLKLDLLVFWRGNPGWFDYEKVSAGAGAPNGRHGVTSRGKSVELKFDRNADSVQLKNDTLALQGANVVLIDGADDGDTMLIAGTRQVDALPPVDAQGAPVIDPIKALIRQMPELFDYLRCDPAFADPNDPASAVTLGACGGLR